MPPFLYLPLHSLMVQSIDDAVSTRLIRMHQQYNEESDESKHHESKHHESKVVD